MDTVARRLKIWNEITSFDVIIKERRGLYVGILYMCICLLAYFFIAITYAILFVVALYNFQHNLGVISGTLFLFVLLFFIFILKMSKLIDSFGYKCHRLLAPDLAFHLERLHHPPVLFLRAFDDDELHSQSWRFRMVGPNRYEDHLMSVLRKVGPPIAVGRPWESLPETGAMRIYVRDDQWQDAIRFFLRHARLVVIIAGTSGGIRWEISETVRIVAPEKLLIVFPEAVRQDIFYRRFFERKRTALSSTSDKEQRFADFRRHMQKIGPLSLPQSIDDHQFLIFCSNGAGIFLKNRWNANRYILWLLPPMWILWIICNLNWLVPWRVTFTREVSFGRTLRPLVALLLRRGA